MDKNLKTGISFNKTLLIPTDFTAKCDNAVLQGIQMAEKLQYKVIIMHVIDRQNESILKNTDQGQDCIGLNFNKYKSDFGVKFGVVIETILRKGNIVSEILSVARELNPSFIILGTDGKQGLEYLFGSHALKLVLHSPCPVIAVQNRSFDEGYKNIVLPVRNDIDPRQAVAWTLKICKLFNSSVRLFLSHETDNALKSRAYVITNQITEVLREKNVQYTVESAGTSHDFAMQVVAYAANTKSDMIIIITRPVDSSGFNTAGWNEKIMFNQDQLAVMCINPVKIGESEIGWLD